MLDDHVGRYASTMRRFVPVLVFMLVLAGCGSSRAPSVTHTAGERAPFVCHHKVPAQLGECIRQELESNGVKPAAPRLSTRFGAAYHAQGVDISRWQPHPAFHELYRQGIRFVIVQGADNCSESNPFFDSQVRSAHEAGMAIGVYVFAEGCAASGQAAALERAAASERSRITLGAHVDAEVPSAYGQACSIVAALSRSFYIVGVYGSPGTYGGGRCRGVVWPAEWGGGAVYPLAGYPFSAVKLRQWCGTCYLAGNAGQIDRDEDLGLLALAHPSPPPESPSQRRARLRRELAGHEQILGRLRVQQWHLRSKLLRYGCDRRVRARERLGPRCEGWRQAGRRVGAHGRLEDRLISGLKRELG